MSQGKRTPRFNPGLAIAACLLFAVQASCSLPRRLPVTPTPLPPSATPLAPQASPTALQPASPTPSTTEAGNAYGGVLIKGTPDFVEQTRRALALLEARAPDAYHKVQTYVGIIEQGEHSGMWAWEEPPRYEVGDPTAFYSVTWYASTIAHDATHSELYHNGQEWSGVDVEKFCNGYQLTVLEQIGAPQSEIDYLASLDGTHCDVDGDGDCDWSDYENRNW